MHIAEETVVLYIAIYNVELNLSREKLFLLTYLTIPLHFPLGCERGEKEKKKREREIEVWKGRWGPGSDLYPPGIEESSSPKQRPMVLLPSLTTGSIIYELTHAPLHVISPFPNKSTHMTKVT